jgi:arginase family enzyme
MGMTKTEVIVFPFDLFGSGGTAGGATLLADEVREVLRDNRRERVRTRARVYTPHVRLREHSFETLADYADWRLRGRQAARQALDGGDFLLWLTGNHLGALPVFDELAGAEDVLVVQLDAHLDIHHFGDCTTELSHGNFLLHCAGPVPRLINAGHRDLLLPADHIAATYHQVYSTIDLARNTGAVLDQMRQAGAGASRIFLDLDCDVFDPANFPAVSQPVPFGLEPLAVLRLLEALPGDKLAGVFSSEFDPGRDQQDRSLAIVVWLIEYLLLRRYERG